MESVRYDLMEHFFFPVGKRKDGSNFERENEWAQI